MYRSVLVPVDDSPLSAHALPWALAAAGDGGGVHLLHVHETVAPVGGEGLFGSGPPEEVAVRDYESRYLRETAERVRAAAPGVRVETHHVVPPGPFAGAFGATAAATGAELAVLATHGRGPLGRLLHGSVADDLSHHVSIPVLLVRPPSGETADLAARPRLSRVLVLLDGSPRAEAILPVAERFAAAFAAECVVATALDEAGRWRAGGVEAAESYLAQAGRRLQPAGCRAVVLRGDSPADAVLGYLAGDGSTVVALASHGREGLARWLHGSVAADLIRHAAGPILTLHVP